MVTATSADSKASSHLFDIPSLENDDSNFSTWRYHVKTKQEDEVGPLPTFKSMVQGSGERHSNSRRPSPASSIRSRGSAGRHSSVLSSHRQSPSGLTRFTGSTAGDPIDVDSLDFSTASQVGGKRKSVPIDDDIEIVDGPIPSTSKGTKGKIPAKPRPTKKR